MSILFDFSKALSKSVSKKADTLVLTINEDLNLGHQAKKINEKTDGFIDKVLKHKKHFKAKAGQTLAISLPQNTDFDTVVFLGVGRLDETHPYLDIEEAGGKLISTLKSLMSQNIAVVLDHESHKDNQNITGPDLVAHLVSGIKLTNYKFETYKTKKHESETDKDKDDTTNVESITFVSDDHKDAKKAAEHLAAEVEGVSVARDLGNEPANRLYPESFANFIQKELDPLGVKVTLLDAKKLKQIGAGAFLAVGQGSQRPPYMVIMEWNGASQKNETYPLALVGKGITFDTGGISIKPAGGMQDMKMDMCGAAAVVGTMKSLALRKAKTNVVGAVALAENMPSHNAYRPGDIIKSLAGKTVEVLNTDAEGRLVLIDTLTHIQKTYKPKTIINLATLTGAMMVSLGSAYCGAFVNYDELWSNLNKESRTSGEKLWRMPLDKQYRKEMESDIADLKNLGGRFAGACTAAAFLEHFIDDDVHWSHLDIAGVAWGKQPKVIYPKGPTGFGVRLLNRYVEQTHEKS